MKDSEFQAAPGKNGIETGHLPPGYRNLMSKPGFRRKVLQIIGDGKCHTIAGIFASFREAFPTATPGTVKNVISSLLHDPPKGNDLVSRKIGKCCQYRLRKSSASSRWIPARQLNDFIEDLSVLLDHLDSLGQLGRFQILPETLRGTAQKMRELLVRLKKVC